MMLGINAILDWLEANAPKECLREPRQPNINKAGIIPLFKENEQTNILLIKPHGKKKHLGPPPWQLIKGTRMLRADTGWEDIKKEADIGKSDQLEPLICSALREGIEEGGLRLDNIAAIGPLGLFDYRSVSNATKKTMQLYALLMKDKVDFDWPNAKHPVTDKAKWFDIATLPEDTREDAREIIEAVREKL